MDRAWEFAGVGAEAKSAGVGFSMETAMKEGRGGKRDENRLMKSYKVAAWVSMALASMLGGLVFGWWEFQFHPTNRQLWMVPFGLVLMVAPIFVMVSVLISSFCTSMNHSTWAVPSSDHVVHQSLQIR